MKQLWFVIFFTNYCFVFLNAQHSSPDTLAAYKINTAINFDGNPNDSIWKSAQRINNFTQRELHFGEPASEKQKQRFYMMLTICI